jgi:hypothetical protein
MSSQRSPYNSPGASSSPPQPQTRHTSVHCVPSPGTGRPRQEDQGMPSARCSWRSFSSVATLRSRSFSRTPPLLTTSLSASRPPLATTDPESIPPPLRDCGHTQSCGRPPRGATLRPAQPSPTRLPVGRVLDLLDGQAHAAGHQPASAPSRARTGPREPGRRVARWVVGRQTCDHGDDHRRWVVAHRSVPTFANGPNPARSTIRWAWWSYTARQTVPTSSSLRAALVS